MSIILYGKQRSPPCVSVLLLAEIIGVQVEIKEIDILNTKDHMTESYLRMNPAHTIPTMDDHGFHIWESRAILGYLMQRYAKDDHLYPKDPKKRALVDNFLHFDCGSLYASFLLCFFPMFQGAKTIEPQLEAYMKDKLEILDTILSRNAYAAGDKLTIADLSLIATLSLPVAFNYNLDNYKNIAKWRAKAEKEIPNYEAIGKKASDQLKDAVRPYVSGH